jgi:hypothetical protein
MPERDRIKSICEGIRLGLSRVVTEPLPERIEELLRRLRVREETRPTATPPG